MKITDFLFDNTDFIPILQQNRNIAKLDPNTLVVTNQLGCLYSSHTMDDILAYDLKFFFRDNRYLGMAAASITRNSQSASLSLFDKDGKVMRLLPKYPRRPNSSSDTEIDRSRPAHEHVQLYSGMKHRFGDLLILNSQYLLENIHPPLLSLASCIRPNHFDALTSERTILFTPNSLAASTFRYENIYRFEVIFAIFILYSLALALGVFLAWRIVRDARQLGLSRQAREFWIIAAVTLGLPVYITYRLTRPAITRVTCPNCGCLRRPDQQNCANCNAPWHLPDLIPPTWKVTIH